MRGGETLTRSAVEPAKGFGMILEMQWMLMVTGLTRSCGAPFGNWNFLPFR
jgi:hypothetical protein